MALNPSGALCVVERLILILGLLAVKDPDDPSGRKEIWLMYCGAASELNCEAPKTCCCRIAESARKKVELPNPSPVAYAFGATNVIACAEPTVPSAINTAPVVAIDKFFKIVIG